VVLFSGILTATRYTDLLDASLIPFLQEKIIIIISKTMNPNTLVIGLTTTLVQRLSSYICC